MVKEFLIISKPSPSWIEYFNTDNISLDLKGNHPLKQLFEQNEITFIHPIDCEQPIHSFGLYRNKKNINPSQLYVNNTNLKSYMDPGDHDNSIKTIIYFNNNLYKSNIRFGKEFYFKRLEKPSLRSEIGETAFNYSVFSTNFYESEKKIGKDVELFNLEVDKNTIDSELAGWVNPIILKIDLNGNLLEDVENLNKYAMSSVNTLAFLFEKKSLIAIEPVLTEESSIQIEWLESLQHDNIKKGPLSLIESLFVSMNTECKIWKPFIALDGLNGSFWIEGHGNSYKSDKKIKKYWIPPDKTISKNLRWYANYWLKLYSGHFKDISYRDMKKIFQSSSQLYKNTQLCNGIPVEGEKWKQANITSVLDLINLYEQSGYWKLTIQTEKHLLGALKKIFKKFSYIFDLKKCHLAFLWVQWDNKKEKGSLYFEDLDFLEYIAQEYIAPKSRILIKLPVNILKSNSKKETISYEFKIKDSYIDLINSPKWGGAQLLLKLSKYITEPLKRGVVIFDYKRGWWVKWYDSLFSCSEDINIQLYPVNSHRIGKMILGKFRLGLESDAYKQDIYFGF